MDAIAFLEREIEAVKEELKTCPENHKPRLQQRWSDLLKELAMEGWKLDGIDPF